MAFLEVVAGPAAVVGGVAGGAPHPGVLGTQALHSAAVSAAVQCAAGYLGLVRGDQHVCRYEEGSILCRRHHIVCFVPHPAITRKCIQQKRSNQT